MLPTVLRTPGRHASALLLALFVAACSTGAGTMGGVLPTIPLRAGTPPPTFATRPTLVPASFGTPQSQPPSSAFGSPVNGARPPVRFTPLAIFDPAAGGVPAITFLLPDGWQAQGGVQWLPEWSRVAHLATTIFDPSSGLTIDWLPIQDFIWFQPPGGLSAPIGGNYQGKAFVPPITDPAQFVAQFWVPTVLQHLGGVSPVAGVQVPSVAQEFARGFGGAAEAYAYRLRYEFNQGGQIWEEDIFLALLYTGNQGITSWYVNFAYTIRAPKGVIDQNIGLLSTIIASRTTTHQWEGIYRLVQALFTQGIRQQLADTEAFGRTLAQYRAESQALQAQVAAERQASQDRIADLRGQALQGIDTYVDPFQGTFVQLPQGWVEYWVNPRGEYLTADVPGFDPNQFDNQGWQRLQRRQ